ncbi:hypothetical protein ACYCFK_16265 [Stutzerimonas stutzeri]
MGGQPRALGGGWVWVGWLVNRGRLPVTWAGLVGWSAGEGRAGLLEWLKPA